MICRWWVLTAPARLKASLSATANLAAVLANLTGGRNGLASLLRSSQKLSRISVNFAICVGEATKRKCSCAVRVPFSNPNRRSREGRSRRLGLIRIEDFDYFLNNAPEQM